MRPMVVNFTAGRRIGAMTNQSSPPPAPDPKLRKQSRQAMAKYGSARLGLFLGLTVILQLIIMLVDAPVPLMFTAILALFMALPLSMLFFKQWRLEAVQSIAEYSMQRKAHKAWVEQELAGR